MKSSLSLCLMVVLLGGCSAEPEPVVKFDPAADPRGHTTATQLTAEANAATARRLALADAADFEDAERGLVARDPTVLIRDEDRTIWNLSAYDFIGDETPATVNPSLWRQARLNNIHGLFEVTQGVWQVRGYDLSNMSVIRGEKGWIVVDPLTSQETAAAAFELVERNLGERPITAVIFTHSHVDHFGGVGGLELEGARIIAPADFMDAATSENVLAGVAMGRRADYMFGRGLARSARGHVDSGLGKGPAVGTIGIQAPTEHIDHTPQPLEIDGVRFVFQYTPDSEAPAELTFYLPDAKAFCGAEIVSRTMHNLYTLRGAKIRDALLWSAYIDQALRLFPDTEVVFNSHHWPVWGRERVVTYLEGQRDVYKFIHDQTLRLANQGATPGEIAETLVLPESLARVFANRGYYGTLRHNSRAVYQAYFGWYDGNPAHLNPHPPEASAVRYVSAMGGGAEVQRKAQEAFDQGDYRWSATLLNHLVFAEPQNAKARGLLAVTYDQLGYQAESGPWRDVYLSAATELRHGIPEEGVDLGRAETLLRNTPMERFLESVATRVNGADAEGKNFKFNFNFPDIDESWVLTLRNSVLHHRRAEPDPEANSSVSITRDLLIRIITDQASAREVIMGDDLEIQGSRLDLLSFFSLLESPNPRFAIVVP